jgi:hypothetical protein
VHLGSSQVQVEWLCSGASVRSGVSVRAEFLNV